MNKKLIYIIGGVLVAGGVGYYLYSQSKKSKESGASSSKKSASLSTDSDDDYSSGSESSSTSKSSSSSEKAGMYEGLSKKETRKAKRADSKTYKDVCGKKPILKKKQAGWLKCVEEQKAMLGFDGDGINNFEPTSSFDFFEPTSSFIEFESVC